MQELWDREVKIIKRVIRAITLLVILITFTCFTVLNPFMWIIAAGEWAFEKNDGFAAYCFSELTRMYCEVLKGGSV